VVGVTKNTQGMEEAVILRKSSRKGKEKANWQIN
jgi:hypothetical protein